MKEKEYFGNNISLKRVVSMLHSPALQRKQGKLSTAWLIPGEAGLPPPALHLGVAMESALPLASRGHEKDYSQEQTGILRLASTCTVCQGERYMILKTWPWAVQKRGNSTST